MNPGNIFFKASTSLIITACVSIIILSCQHQPENLDLMPTVCFQSQVLPIFRNNCAISGCHNGNSESDYDFSSANGILASIVPSDPLKSPAYRAITAFWGESAMPPKQPLSEENRTIIRLWIEQGAVISYCSGTQGGGNSNDSTYYNARACFTRDIQPIIQANCAIPGCHDGTSQEEDAPVLNGYPSVMSLVVPASPLSSKLYRVITNGGEDIMPPPPQPALTKAQIDSIYSWIAYGALDENCGSICDTSSTVTFSGIVWPIVQTYCLGCHSGPNAQKGQHLENYQDISSAAASGKLLGVLKGLPGYAVMPPAGALSSCEISEIEKWISSGTPNNRLVQ